MLRATVAHSQVRQIDLRLESGTQLDLGFLSSLSNSLNRIFVISDVNSRLLFEQIEEILGEHAVYVLSSATRVSIGRLDFEDSLHHLHNRNIECSSTQIEHRNHLTLVFIKSVGEASRSRLVNDP